MDTKRINLILICAHEKCRGEFISGFWQGQKTCDNINILNVPLIQSDTAECATQEGINMPGLICVIWRFANLIYSPKLRSLNIALVWRALTAKSEHVLGRRKRKRIFLLFKESYLVRFLLSLRDNKIKWFKWDLKWQLQSSIYLFSAKNNESNCRFMGVKSNLVAILSTI